MPLVNYPQTLPPMQVEVVPPKRKKPQPAADADSKPKEMKRSCEGALHLRPGPLFLTRDEMEYLKDNRPEVHGKLQFIALTDEEKKELQASPAPTEAKPEESAGASEEISPPTQTTGGRKGARGS